MNLKMLSNDLLFSQTKTAIAKERLSTIAVLHHFREIERRRAFNGYNSLFELATKEFGYSGAGAQRRIAAMRLLREMPQITSKIESGELSLSNAASAQTYFRRARPNPSEKTELINACLGKSSREVEREIKRREPDADKRADVRFSSDSRLRMSINISEDLYEKLETLKHDFKLKTLEEVISLMADRATKETISTEQLKADQNKQISLDATAPNDTTGPKDEKTQFPAPEVKVRHIPAATKRIVLKKTPYQCSYLDPVTRTHCGETKKLEFDHITPFCEGGPHLPINLRFMCSHHNRISWQHYKKSRSEIQRR